MPHPPHHVPPRHPLPRNGPQPARLSSAALALALVGILFMTANNILLTWAETMVASGIASLLVSTMPIMVAVIEAALPGGEALNKRGWAGTLLGTLGMVALVWPSLRAGAPHRKSPSARVHSPAASRACLRPSAPFSAASSRFALDPLCRHRMADRRRQPLQRRPRSCERIPAHGRLDPQRRRRNRLSQHLRLARRPQLPEPTFCST